MSGDTNEFYKVRYKTLEDLPGIGDGIIGDLRKLGFTTVENLATADPKELVFKGSGIGEEVANKIIEEAKKIDKLAVGFVTAKEYVKIRGEIVRLTSGCESLDTLLRGGLRKKSITEFFGEFGSGKSQICHQLAVTVQLPLEKGGLDGGCMYIDTEKVFEPARCMQMAERFPSLDPDTILDGILVAKAHNSVHQMMLLTNSDEIIKENNIKLIVIDSLTSHFRSEYLGRGTLAPRQQLINKHMFKLKRLAGAFDAVAVVTNQVLATPTEYASYAPSAIGGNIVGHMAHTRLFIRKGQRNQRIVQVTASPFLPWGETPVTISDQGIVSDEEVLDV